MKVELSEDIISDEDLRAVINELKDYLVFLRHGQIKSHVSKHSSGPGPELTRPAAEMLSQATAHHPLNIGEMEQLISELERIYASSVKLTIILAALPNLKLKKLITAWVRTNIKEGALIEFSYNQSLFGGMVVTAGSHIFDWSLRRQIMTAEPKLNEMIANHV